MNPKTRINGTDCTSCDTHTSHTPKSTIHKIMDTANSLKEFNTALRHLATAKYKIAKDGLVTNDELNQSIKDQLNLA